MAERLSLRIDNGVRIIEVNDNGDTIALRLGDSEFQKKGVEAYQTLQNSISQLEDTAEEENEQILENFRNVVEKSIDDWIGEGTCKKVFGDISPSLDLLAYFFDEIIPIINEYNTKQANRNKQITNKYNPSRKGR